MSAFRIDVYNANGVRENGRTNNIARVQVGTRANCVGALSFTIPTVEYVNIGMAARKWYYLYHKRLGFLGRFRHLDQDFDENAETVVIKCEDALASLIDVSLDFNMASVSNSVSAELNRVLGRAGWTATLANNSAEYSSVSLDYQGINAFQALDSLRQMQRGFFTLSGATSVKFGRWTDALRDSSAYTLITNAAEMPTGAAISSLTVVGTSQNVVNCIIPKGQGIGTTQVDLSRSDRATPDYPYQIKSRPNWDGTNTDGAHPSGALTHTYYIEDETSIAANGRVERVAVFSDIRPVENTIEFRRLAANALYDVAAAYMQQYKNPTTEYKVAVIKTTELLSAGDVVMIDYRGVSETAQGKKSRVFIDKKRFFVVEATHNFDDASGEPVTTLTLSQNGAKLADANDVVVNLLADLDKIKLRPIPSIGQRMDTGPTLYISPSVPFKHTIKYGKSILTVNSAKYVFSVAKMVAPASNSTGASTSSTTSSAGETTTTSSSSSTSTTSSGGDSALTSGASSSSTSSMSVPWITSTGYGYIPEGTPFDRVFATTPADTGGVVGEGALISHGGAGDYYQHWHSSARHSHLLPEHSHSYSLVEHSHGIAHTHTVVLSAHAHGMAHTHTNYIPPHAHGMAHTHPLLFGVVVDSVGATGVAVYFKGEQVTPIRNYLTGAFAGNTIDGEGWFEVNLTPKLEALADFHGAHEITIEIAGGRCQIFGKTNEILTVQPIAVTDNDY
jgi:hypothetical protein